MTQSEKDAFRANADELLRMVQEDRRDTVVGMMHLTLSDFDPETVSLTVSYPALPWEQNPDGVIHGGIVCTMLDTAMGIVNYAATGQMTPTMSLTTSFLRPAPGEGTLVARARVTMTAHSAIYASAELWEKDAPEALVATAQGVFHRRQG